MFRLPCSSTLFPYTTLFRSGRRELLARLLTCQAVAGLLVAAVGFAIPSLRLGRAAFLQIGAAATLGLIAWRAAWLGRDRKSTRLNSSHGYISYAVFCLKKKK